MEFLIFYVNRSAHSAGCRRQDLSPPFPRPPPLPRAALSNPGPWAQPEWGDRREPLLPSEWTTLESKSPDAKAFPPLSVWITSFRFPPIY